MRIGNEKRPPNLLPVLGRTGQCPELCSVRVCGHLWEGTQEWKEARYQFYLGEGNLQRRKCRCGWGPQTWWGNSSAKSTAEPIKYYGPRRVHAKRINGRSGLVLVRPPERSSPLYRTFVKFNTTTSGLPFQLAKCHLCCLLKSWPKMRIFPILGGSDQLGTVQVTPTGRCKLEMH